MKYVKLASAAVVVGMLAASPAMATFGWVSPISKPAPQKYSSCGYLCGGKDANGCSVSPVTKHSCTKDLLGDIKDLKCDLIDLISDILHGKKVASTTYDVKEIESDLKEIKFDLSVLKGLKK